MPIMAPVGDDGNLVTQFTQETNEKERANSNSTLGKEAFLQLLVAQMQYQDPLEPMDNTEYVSQLATFSQLEAIQNMGQTLSYGQATDLVGKTVAVKVTDANGDMNLKWGVVDYVIFEGGQPYLVMGEEKYPYADLDTVLSDAYLDRMANYEIASAVSSYIDSLPDAADANLDYYDKVVAARKAYDSLTEEQKKLVDQELVDKLVELEQLMENMKKLQDGETKEPDDTEGSGDTENSGDVTEPEEP